MLLQPCLLIDQNDKFTKEKDKTRENRVSAVHQIYRRVLQRLSKDQFFSAYLTLLLYMWRTLKSLTSKGGIQIDTDATVLVEDGHHDVWVD